MNDFIRSLGLRLEKPLRKRYGFLRRRIIKKHRWATARKEVFQLNILPGEFDTDISSIAIEEECEKDPQRRELRTQVENLQQRLQTMQQELAKSADERESVVRERERILKEQEEERLKAKECAERNIFLANHVAAVESDVVERQREVDRLEADNQDLRREKEKATKPYGLKPLSECGPDAVTKTKQAYRQRFGEPIDKFGENRRLTLDKMVLKDKENGQRLEINMSTPPTYETLDPYQEKQLKEVSRWKDRCRLNDDDYAS